MSLITNPALSVITACIISMVANELVKGSREIRCVGDAVYFDKELMRGTKEADEKAIHESNSIVMKQKSAYAEAERSLSEITKTEGFKVVVAQLQHVSDSLNLGLRINSFEEFQDTMRSGGKLVI